MKDKNIKMFEKIKHLFKTREQVIAPIELKQAEENKLGNKTLLGKVDINGFEKHFKYVDKEGKVYAVERSARSYGKKDVV